MFIYSEVAAVASIYEKYKKAANLHAGIELLENSTGPKALKTRSKVDVHVEEGMAEPPEQELQETHWLS
ncbi:uncharacterized protein SEPMUDRAFT_120836 [Sphaerulina musiva SO2202]|uniref:Uncharacterized protein n=1 Tax=Sphaerulina musiva (strain SO2202) TaxID=692275 RepID=M3CZ57_SPHMS|nr:uncharacterized protein SEPMUDRAFT_120836 [Sphaerulina musiva SO2202]EMF08941.1 hypothetical protein SEPMUDRAFT_120836 [Sphaerulina musiva SO2202]